MAGDFLGGVKNFVHGVGEYARRTDPRYAIADQQRQELEFLKNADRRQAMIKDVVYANSAAQAGRWDTVQSLLQKPCEKYRRAKRRSVPHSGIA